VSSFIISICVRDNALYIFFIVSLSSVVMFLNIENTNIGGVVGLIRVSNKWMYAAIFSLIDLLTSLIRKDDSFSWIFSMSKSSAISLNSGKPFFCANSLYVSSKSISSFSMILL